MNEDLQHFLRALAGESATMTERAVALLWWHGLEDHNSALTAGDLVRHLETGGFPQQNVSRLNAALVRDSRTASAGGRRFRIRIAARPQLDSTYLALTLVRPIRRVDSVLPLELFRNTRDYLERVALQLNASYDAGLYDCSAVMARRLLETLIIEVYEKAGRAVELKGADGHFMMLNGLLSVIQSDPKVHLGRGADQGLRDFKRLGDLSAHNRRFNARRNDLDRVRDGLRVAVEELLHLASLSE